MSTLKTTNIVILARNHNPSIATKDWLIENGIISKNERSPTICCVFSYSLIFIGYSETKIINRNPIS